MSAKWVSFPYIFVYLSPDQTKIIFRLTKLWYIFDYIYNMVLSLTAIVDCAKMPAKIISWFSLIVTLHSQWEIMVIIFVSLNIMIKVLFRAKHLIVKNQNWNINLIWIWKSSSLCCIFYTLDVWKLKLRTLK